MLTTSDVPTDFRVDILPVFREGEAGELDDGMLVATDEADDLWVMLVLPDSLTPDVPECAPCVAVVVPRDPAVPHPANMNVPHSTPATLKTFCLICNLPLNR